MMNSILNTAWRYQKSCPLYPAIPIMQRRTATLPPPPPPPPPQTAADRARVPGGLRLVGLAYPRGRLRFRAGHRAAALLRSATQDPRRARRGADAHGGFGGAGARVPRQ